MRTLAARHTQEDTDGVRVGTCGDTHRPTAIEDLSWWASLIQNNAYNYCITNSKILWSETLL